MLKTIEDVAHTEENPFKQNCTSDAITQSHFQTERHGNLLLNLLKSSIRISNDNLKKQPLNCYFCKRKRKALSFSLRSEDMDVVKWREDEVSNCNLLCTVTSS